MSTLIVNGHGPKFTVTSKTHENGVSNFTILTKNGNKKVKVDEKPVEVNFNDAA